MLQLGKGVISALLFLIVFQLRPGWFGAFGIDINETSGGILSKFGIMPGIIGACTPLYITNLFVPMVIRYWRGVNLLYPTQSRLWLQRVLVLTAVAAGSVLLIAVAHWVL